MPAGCSIRVPNPWLKKESLDLWFGGDLVPDTLQWFHNGLFDQLGNPRSDVQPICKGWYEAMVGNHSFGGKPFSRTTGETCPFPDEKIDGILECENAARELKLFFDETLSPEIQESGSGPHGCSLRISDNRLLLRRGRNIGTGSVLMKPICRKVPDEKISASGFYLRSFEDGGVCQNAEHVVRNLEFRGFRV